MNCKHERLKRTCGADGREGVFCQECGLGIMQCKCRGNTPTCKTCGGRGWIAAEKAEAE